MTVWLALSDRSVAGVESLELGVGEKESASVVEDELWRPSEDSARSSVVTDDSAVVSTVVSVCSEIVADEDAISVASEVAVDEDTDSVASEVVEDEDADSVASEVAEDEEADCVVSDDSGTGAKPFISSIK